MTNWNDINSILDADNDELEMYEFELELDEEYGDLSLASIPHRPYVELAGVGEKKYI